MHACMHVQPNKIGMKPHAAARRVVMTTPSVFDNQYHHYRFTGLLLATKFLPAGDASAIKAVHDAVGIAFVQRLLLALSSSHVPSDSRLISDITSMSAACNPSCMASSVQSCHGPWMLQHSLPPSHASRGHRHLSSSRRCGLHQQGWALPSWRASAACQTWQRRRR